MASHYPSDCCPDCVSWQAAHAALMRDLGVARAQLDQERRRNAELLGQTHDLREQLVIANRWATDSR